MPTFRQEVTTDSSGNAQLDVKLDKRYIFSGLRAYSDEDRLEFFRLYAQKLVGAGVEDVGDGEDGGGGTGFPGHFILSPPQIQSGNLVEANETLRVKIQAGIDKAATVFTVLFDWRLIK